MKLNCFRELRNDILEDAARACEQRADSLREGSGVARQCALDIRSKKDPVIDDATVDDEAKIEWHRRQIAIICARLGII